MNPIRAILILCALMAMPSCAIYDTAADLVGLPRSTRPAAMRGAEFAPSTTNIYDVEINDATLEYLKRRNAR